MKLKLQSLLLLVLLSIVASGGGTKRDIFGAMWDKDGYEPENCSTTKLEQRGVWGLLLFLLWGCWGFLGASCVQSLNDAGILGKAARDNGTGLVLFLPWFVVGLPFLIFLSSFIHADRTCVRNFRCCKANHLPSIPRQYCDEIPHGGGWPDRNWRSDGQHTMFVPADDRFLSYYIEEGAAWRNKHKCYPDASCTDHMVPVNEGYLMTTMDIHCDHIWGCSCDNDYRLSNLENTNYGSCESSCGNNHQCTVFSFDGETCNTYSQCEETPGHSGEEYYKRTDFPTCLDVFGETSSKMCSQAEIWETTTADDEDHCKARCNLRRLCQYVTFHEGLCYMFETCDVTTPSSFPATIFQKRFYRYDPPLITTTTTTESALTTTSGGSVVTTSSGPVATTEPPHYDWGTCEVVDDPWPDHRRELDGSEYPVAVAPQPIRRKLGVSRKLASRLLETMGTVGTVWTPVDIAWTMFDMWQTLMGGESNNVLSPECATDAAIQCFNWMSCAECVLSYAELEVTDYHEFSKTGQDSCSRWYDRIALYKNTPSCFANSCEGACPAKYCSENACWYYYENCKGQLSLSSHLSLSFAFLLGFLMLL